MIRKIAQLRNLIIILLVAECILLFGLYLLLDSSLLFAFSVYALTVSYTHLDVYKRQCFYRRFLRSIKGCR